tara:strand:- start:1330 stop:2307 length:978 start_codon:yes stop_codon:yes gene_type:complete
LLSTRLVTNFDQIRSNWNILLNQTELNAIFFSVLWQETWWNHFGSKKAINIIEAFQGDDVVGIAPLMIEKSVLTFISSTDLVDYGNFIIRDNNREAYLSIWESMLDLEWDRCELWSLPANSPILEIYPKLAENYGFRVEVIKEDVVPRLQLPKTWDDYLDNLSKKKRHEIRRKIRKLESFGKVEFRELKESKLVKKEMDSFFDLHKSSSVEKSQFLNNKRRRFIEEVSVKFAENKMLNLSFLDIDSNTVAACLGFETRDSYFLYNSGYDPEFSDLSVGIVATLYAIKNAIIRQNKIFDFLRGGEFYKYQLGAEDQYIFRLNISRL